MTMIKCPECSGQVSSRALACPHCGDPDPLISREPRLSYLDGFKAGVGVWLAFCVVAPLLGLLVLLVLLVFGSGLRL